MSTWMRGWVLAACMVGAVACEEETSPGPAGAQEGAGVAAAKLHYAEPDAPIEPGDHVPPRPADTDPDEGPDPAATGDLTAALSRLAQRYAGGWVAASEAFEAELEGGASSDYQLVLGSAHCYRIMAAGEASLEDVDLRLFDPNGVQVQQDEGSDRFPIVGLSYPVCPPQPAAYRLQAVAVKGSGALRVQAFHGP